MDVFDIAAGAGGDFLCDAAIDAGYELGVFEVLGRMPPTGFEAIAKAVDVWPARARLRALLDVLAAIGAVTRHGDRFGPGTPPRRPVVPRSGWGLMAEVIRTNRPLALDHGEATRRLHRHLAGAGAAAARELAPLLGHESLLDLGGGAGAYTAAFLDANPAARATLVDTPEVIAIAREDLARFGSRVSLVAGDGRDAEAGSDHGTALLANVLHFYPFSDCEALCAAAAHRVAPGGAVVIKDLRVDDGREGPLAGLLFALNMAVYTEAGDVHETGVLRALLARVGLVAVDERRLATSPETIVVSGHKPIAPAPRPASGTTLAELDAALARTGADAWHQLQRSGTLRDPTAPAPTLQYPAALRRILGSAVDLERDQPGGGGALIRHYSDVMPRMRVAQLASNAEPAATLFHTQLDWARLPRLSTAIDRLFAVVSEPVLGASSADVLRAATPTLAALYERTHYGGFMPLLYGYPADLEYFARRAAEDDLDTHGVIDRYLTAPIVHELCHLGRDREPIQPPHLDECIAGWLGVHVHPQFAYPAAGQDDAIYAAPWLAQVGQAIARAFGVSRVVAAHARGPSALPAAFVANAARLGWDDWHARRTLHFLSDTFDPAPWVALALLAGAKYPLSGLTLAELRAFPIAQLAVALPPDPGLDLVIVTDALRAMCLDNALVDGSFRTRTRIPDAAITIDAVACRVTTPRRGGVDQVDPSYWLPPAVAARIAARGLTGYHLRLGAINAIPEAAAAIHDGSPAVERAGFALVPRRAETQS